MKRWEGKEKKDEDKDEEDTIKTGYFVWLTPRLYSPRPSQRPYFDDLMINSEYDSDCGRGVQLSSINFCWKPYQ